MVDDINGSLYLRNAVSIDIAYVRRIPEMRNGRPLIVGHMLNIHRNLCGSRAILSEIFDQMQILAEQWVVTKVGNEPRPIIGINKMLIAAMNDIHIPPH